MKYFEFDFQVNPFTQDASDLLMSLLVSAGFESFIDAENGFKAYVQESEFSQDVLNMTIQEFPFHGVEISYTQVHAEDKNWNEQWENEGFRPVLIAGSVLITNNPDNDNTDVKYKVLIKPRQAFGSGTHQTTSMIVERLLNLDLKDKSVVDAGCGTGILGIFSKIRGAKYVFSYDIDSWSVNNTLENARLNNIDDLDVVEGNVSVLHDKKDFDLILANINRNILLADISSFADAVKDKGRIILSGFYTEDVPILLQVAEGVGLSLIDSMERENWVSLMLEKIITS